MKRFETRDGAILFANPNYVVCVEATDVGPDGEISSCVSLSDGTVFYVDLPPEDVVKILE